MKPAVPMFTQWSLVRRSLSFFWRTHATLALGIAVATAVIVGALVVGDSVRSSLRGLVLNRLANIECLLQARTFFGAQRLDGITNGITAGGPDDAQAAVAPVIYLPNSTIESLHARKTLRASGVQVTAVDERFFKHLAADAALDFPAELLEDQVVINAGLATELRVTVGDEVTLRVGQPKGVPADNPLGRRDESSKSIPRQKVVAILPDRGIGGLSFLSGQSVPKNVFASLETVQDVLEVNAQVNAAFVFSDHPSQAVGDSDASWCDELNQQLRPNIEDYGLKLERHRREFPNENETSDQDSASNASAASDMVYDYYQVSSDELILDEETSAALMSVLQAHRATRQITYLANSIRKVSPLAADVNPARTLASIRAAEALRRERRRMEISVEFTVGASLGLDSEPETRMPLSREVPYSIVVGVEEESSELGLPSHVAISDEEIYSPYCWINSWLAEQISAEPGDWIEVKYFQPETVDGKTVEETVVLNVAGIVPLTEPARGYQRSRPAIYDKPPSVFNDPNLTSSVPGVTDQDSISNWDLPFELKLKDLILPVDDVYWNNHRLTPKIFMPYRTASSTRWFGSRFGRTTAIRIPAASVDENSIREEMEEALLATRGSHGLVFRPIRQQQLKAASGTTPFDMLFLSLSFFVIVAALLLVVLLFKLGIQKRTSQLGMLAAHGFTTQRIRGTLLRELALVAILGAGLGVLLGLGYAKLMIVGLESWWIGAISERFLSFHYAWQSLLIGAVAGVLASLLAITLSLRKLSSASPLSLLRGEDPDAMRTRRKRNHVSLWLAGLGALGAMALIFAGLGQTGMARAGSFFGSGMLLLASALIAVRQWIEAGAFRSNARSGGLLALAWRAIGRNPSRSALSLGLLSVASFLIASMGVFRVSPSASGYGGFNLLGESAQPIYQNIGIASVRSEVIGQEAGKLAATSIVPLRTRRGEDASCNNLFQVSEPTILGIPDLLQQVYDLAPGTARFSWAATENPDRPWTSLDGRGRGTKDDPIPVIIDQNTAAWSLKQGASLGAIVQLDIAGQTIYFRTVGLLSNSVLQGKLMISERHFQYLFPKISGYNTFLIRTGQFQSIDMVSEVLENGWGDVGLDVTSSAQVLQRMLGVQNTYITAFQALGALGLLLGTFGLVAVQLRNVVERRSELALMQAMGFSRDRLSQLLTLETALLLVGGLLIGVLCATVALVPYVIETGPQLSVLSPLAMLAGVLVVGLLAAAIAVRSATRHPVLQGLRAE